MDPVSKTLAAPALPAEFAHPALQQLMASGLANGSIDSTQLKGALEASEIAPQRMKTVLRALDEHGIAVTLDTEHAARAVATTTTRRGASQKTSAKSTAKKGTGSAGKDDDAKSAAKKAAAKKAAPDQNSDDELTDDEAAEAAATRPAAKKAAAKKAPAKKTAAGRKKTDEDEIDSADEETAESDAFVIRQDDEDDAPAQQVVTAGATADPVKD